MAASSKLNFKIYKVSAVKLKLITKSNWHLFYLCLTSKKGLRFQQTYILNVALLLTYYYVALNFRKKISGRDRRPHMRRVLLNDYECKIMPAV